MNLFIPAKYKRSQYSKSWMTAERSEISIIYR
jgi:hypothetical protein